MSKGAGVNNRTRADTELVIRNANATVVSGEPLYHIQQYQDATSTSPSNEVTVSETELRSKLENYIQTACVCRISKVESIFNEAISSLLRSREFLGLQLDFALHNISKEDFEERSKEYLVEASHVDEHVLREKIDIFLDLVSCPVDSEIISEVFQCRLEDAESILHQLVVSYESEKAENDNAEKKGTH